MHAPRPGAHRLLRPWRLLTISASVSTLAVAVMPVGTQPNSPPQPLRRDESYVRLDVYATRGGVAVSDLGPDALEVFEDEVPQRVEAFRRPVLPSPSDVPPASAPRPVQALPPADDRHTRAFVLFL